MFARSRRRRVSADDKLLFVNALQLDPDAASSSGLVNRCPLLAHDSLQAQTFHLFQQLLRRTSDLVRIPDGIRSFLPQQRKQLLATLQRKLEQIFFSGLKKVEHVVIDRKLSTFHFEGLQQLEGRPAFFVERYDLSIEHAFARGQIPDGLHNFGIARAQFILVARHERDLLSVLNGQSADAVEFQLIHPVPRPGWTLHEPRLHRFDKTRPTIR